VSVNHRRSPPRCFRRSSVSPASDPSRFPR
jgi:hypothetical protein